MPNIYQTQQTMNIQLNMNLQPDNVRNKKQSINHHDLSDYQYNENKKTPELAMNNNQLLKN